MPCLLPEDYVAQLHVNVWGHRPKRTGLMANFDISSLAVECDQSHEHAPWHSFSNNTVHFHTAEENAYPKPLCDAVVLLLIDLAISEGYAHCPQDLFTTSPFDPDHARHLLRASVGVQPRGHQFSLLPSSFSTSWVAPHLLPPMCHPSQKLDPPFPKGSVLSPQLLFDDGTTVRASWTRTLDDTRKMKVLVPLYAEVADEIANQVQSAYLREQARTLSSILDTARELSREELKRKTSGDQVVRNVNSKKRLLGLQVTVCGIAENFSRCNFFYTIKSRSVYNSLPGRTSHDQPPTFSFGVNHFAWPHSRLLADLGPCHLLSLGTWLVTKQERGLALS